jgi:circadian clock protein KaiB
LRKNLGGVDPQYQLKLFVAGSSNRTTTAVANLQALCDEKFPGDYVLVVVDVLLNPEIAEHQKVLATPTLIKEFPLPSRRIIGDLSDKDKVFSAMGLNPDSKDTH